MTRFALAAVLGASVPAFAQGSEDWQPFVLSTDARTLTQGRIAAETGGGYDSVPQGLTPRPQDAQVADAWVAAAVGLWDRLEIDGLVSFGQTPGNPVGLGSGRAELRVEVLDSPGGVPLALSLAGGYQVDWQMQQAAEAGLMISGDLGPVHLTGNVRAAHYFHPGRDPVDIYLSAGALVRVFRWVRLGVEYLGEEIEGVAGTDVDVGPGGRQYVGASVVFVGLGPCRLNLTAGPVFTAGATGILVRGSIGLVL
jgi:hypothetical protein